MHPGKVTTSMDRFHSTPLNRLLGAIIFVRERLLLKMGTVNGMQMRASDILDVSPISSTTWKGRIEEERIADHMTRRNSTHHCWKSRHTLMLATPSQYVGLGSTFVTVPLWHWSLQVSWIGRNRLNAEPPFGEDASMDI
jgi:hypothetical protein